ncbi:BA14K family protein [Bradyrhizobium tropiciagri]|uniref:BA14K family protein n=1 Tax=Bradyrhizobium tropiciagri TaxID=312253 RepID=UPI000A634197
MFVFKALIAAALLSAVTVTSATAQYAGFASDHPDAFDAEYPNRDSLNGGALTPAGRMGLELPGGAAWVHSANAYAGMGSVRPSFCGQRYRSYDPATSTFLGYDGRRHPCQ